MAFYNANMSSKSNKIPEKYNTGFISVPCPNGIVPEKWRTFPFDRYIAVFQSGNLSINGEVTVNEPEPQAVYSASAISNCNGSISETAILGNDWKIRVNTVNSNGSIRAQLAGSYGASAEIGWDTEKHIASNNISITFQPSGNYYVIINVSGLD